MDLVSPDRLPPWGALPALDADEIGQPALLVDLDAAEEGSSAKNWAQHEVSVGPAGAGRILVGVASRPLGPKGAALAQCCDVTYLPEGERRATARVCVAVPDPRAAADGVVEQVARTPGAALALAHLLRAAEGLDGQRALMVESFAYSMLLAGPEYQTWLRTRARRETGTPLEGQLVRLDRTGGRLEVVLDHPSRRNAYSARLRDELHEALRVALADPSIDSVALSGTGLSFSAGGDLDEFGTTGDPVLAHVIRTTAGVATALEALRTRLEVRVQGPCVGAGVEIAAFGSRVSAHPDSTFRLPEVLMGLLPGAGGTVSIARRIGRWRLVHLCLSGQQIDARHALDWGLVDEVRV